MLSRFIFLCIAINVYLFADNQTFKDLGIFGNQFEIQEEDALVTIQRESRKITKEKIFEAMSEAKKNVFTSSFDLGECTVNRDKTLDPTIILEKPIDLSKYGVYIKAGEKFNPIEKGLISSYIMFLNTNNPLHVKLAEELSTSTSNRIMFIVANGDLLKLNHLTNEIYKIDEPSAKAFKVECLPTVYVQQEDQFFVREYALKNNFLKSEK